MLFVLQGYNYSHVGSVMFPRWEQMIPILGIKCSHVGNNNVPEGSVYRQLKQRLLANKGPLLQNKGPLLQNKERLLQQKVCFCSRWLVDN